MKIKITYLIVATLIAFLNYSCEDDKDEKSALTGEWSYEEPHFVFDYAQDSISITLGKDQRMSIAVSDCREKFNQMATEKMGAYFKGITLDGKGKMTIKAALKDGQEISLNAAYVQTGDILEVSLDSNDMEAMMGTTKIPAISFKYKQSNNQLAMYFDQIYVETMYSMMQDQLMKMILPQLGVDMSKPEIVAAVEASLKAQVQLILDNVRKLEIGFILKKTSPGDIL